MIQPVEDYPNFFPNVIPPSFSAILPPPDAFTVLTPTKNLKFNGILITTVVLAFIVVVSINFLCWLKWCKKKHQDDSKAKESEHVKKRKSRKVRSTKNTKKGSNVHERDIPVYGYDRRLSKSNGRLIEARYGKEATRNYDYEGDVESGMDEYSRSEDEANFYEKSDMSVIYAKDDTENIAHQGGADTSLEGETSHNNQSKEVELAKDATVSDVPETNNKELMTYAKDDWKSNAYEGEGDTCSESEIGDNEQSTMMELAIDARKSNVSERDSESKDRSGKSKKGKGQISFSDIVSARFTYFCLVNASHDTTYIPYSKQDGVAREAILADLSNTLFDLYSSDAYSTKLLLKKLDQTHNTNSQGLEKYSVARFLEFKLVDNKSMTEQVHEFEMIVHALKESRMDLPEKFKVMSVIEKLPQSWEEFSLSLKRQNGEITWTNLMLDISVQEKHKSKQGHVMSTEHSTSKVNVATVGLKRKAVPKKVNSNKPKSDKDKDKKPKANKPCEDCPTKKAKKTEVVAHANAVSGTASGPVVNMVVGEATTSETNGDRLFVSYQQSHSLTVKMGNASVAQVLGMGNMDLKFPSGRILSLTRVHHVPDMRGNIISGSCLVSSGFQISFKCNKVVLIHTGTFFGKGYLSNGLFVINVEPVLGNLNNNIIPSVNYVESSDIWHSRLGHLNFGALKGGEYTSNAFIELCANNGIVHEVTPPYTPESNGVAERKNRKFKDMINSMMISSGFPKYMWEKL
ncbi:hypothetical protein AgCh_024838 [Apium graveolens]